jgi:hypothetical protein
MPDLPPVLANADKVDKLLAQFNKDLNSAVLYKELKDEDIPPMPLNCPEMVYQRYVAKKTA